MGFPKKEFFYTGLQNTTLLSQLQGRVTQQVVDGQKLGESSGGARVAYWAGEYRITLAMSSSLRYRTNN